MTRSFLYSLTVLTLISFIGCAEQKMEGIYELRFDKDLIPEGIAIDPINRKVYLNSLKDNKIVRSSFDGSDIEVVVSSGEHNYQSGFGMTIKGDTLYALGNGLLRDDNTSILLLVDIRTNQLIKSYELDDTSFVYLNDIAVSSTNDIYITDSNSSSIYTLNKKSGQLEIFISNVSIPNSNGIAISDDDDFLYLATWEGIKVVDLTTKEIVNTINEENQGIDGLKYHKVGLVGIINVWEADSGRNGMYQFQLSDDGRRITERKKIIVFDESFNTPTTLALLDDHACFIKNTHLGYFDENKNVINEPDSLRSYKLMIHQLE